LGLRLGAINHDDALGILDALIHSDALHDAANPCRERREREEYLRTVANPCTACSTAQTWRRPASSAHATSSTGAGESAA
jgi:hypothetical protein